MVPREMLFNSHLVEFWFRAYLVKPPLGEGKIILQVLKKIIFMFHLLEFLFCELSLIVGSKSGVFTS